MSGAASRNPWTLSKKGGAGDDTSVHPPQSWTKVWLDDDSDGGPLCDTCNEELDSSMAKPCIICSKLHCNPCMMRCAICGYEMCRSCIECQCYSDNEWIVEVVRKKDGQRIQICIGYNGCLHKEAHKDAYELADKVDGAVESSESEESGADAEERRKEALRELADLA